MSKPKYCGGYMNNQVKTNGKTLRSVLEKVQSRDWIQPCEEHTEFGSAYGESYNHKLKEKILKQGIKEINESVKKRLAEIIVNSSLWNLGKDSHNALSELVEAIYAELTKLK